MRSRLLFFLTYLLPLVLSIIPSFFIAFKTGLVFMALLLTSFHLTLHLTLRQSLSKIPLHHSILKSFLWCTSRFCTSFHFFIQPLSSVISKNSTKYRLYADDTQLYISFTSSNSTSSLEILYNTFFDILSWMNSN